MTEPVTDATNPLPRLRTGKAACFRRSQAPKCPRCKSGAMRVKATVGEIQYRECIQCGHRCKTERKPE